MALIPARCLSQPQADPPTPLAPRWQRCRRSPRPSLLATPRDTPRVRLSAQVSSLRQHRKAPPTLSSYLSGVATAVGRRPSPPSYPRVAPFPEVLLPASGATLG